MKKRVGREGAALAGLASMVRLVGIAVLAGLLVSVSACRCNKGSDAGPGDAAGGADATGADATGGADAASTEDCTNGVDDDADGAVDCADSECMGTAACQTEVCNDFIDNDGDGDVDCQDMDCMGDAACANPEDCTDGMDNNGDGLVDCDDPMCLGISPDCGEVCGDGIDNDGDGAVDCLDLDCTGIGACSGTGTTCAYQGDPPHTCECADVMDNDGDGAIDTADLHCFGPLDDDESAYATGIPGDNQGSMAGIECPFDGNSGIGNDLDACCNPDPSMNATPNGCDHTACCEIDVNGNGTGEYVRIGGICDFAPSCGMAGTLGCTCTGAGDCDPGQFCVDDDDMPGASFCATCEPCTPNAMCSNLCKCGETCFGGFVQTGCGGPGSDGGMCPAGVTPCPSGNSDCDTAANETCQGGCCYASCPVGVTPCVFASDCPMATEVCVTGCCVVIG